MDSDPRLPYRGSMTGRLASFLILASYMCGACGSVGTKRDGGGGGGGSGGSASDGPGPAGAGGGGGAAATDAPGAGGGGGSPADAGTDMGTTPACNQASPFGAPAQVMGLNSATRDDGLSLTSDGLTAFLSSFRAATVTVDNIYTASRAST